MALSIRFPGLANITGADFTLSHGVSPSICTMRIVPQGNLELPPGPLTITDGSTTLTFPDCAIDRASFRKDGDGTHQRWSLQIKDRRWRWKYGSISGVYNRRLSDGLLDSSSTKNPQELIALCLDALGETGYDLSNVPVNVYPYAVWDNINPAVAIQRILDKIGCRLILGLDNRVKVYPVGLGLGLATGYRIHKSYGLKPATRPSTLRLAGGPIVYQTKLSTAAIARSDIGEHALLDDISYEPATTWYEEHPCILYGVADDDHRASLDSVFRSYRITGQAHGGMNPPGSTVSVTKVYQYELLDVLIDSAYDLDDVRRTQLPYIEGDFWPYSDEPTDVDMERYTGTFRINKNEATVEFPYPLWSLTTSGVPQKPSLYLTAAYGVRDQYGALERFGATRPIGGTGGVYPIQVPELFYSVKAAYGSDGISLASATDTSAQAISEAEAYLDIYQQRFAQPEQGQVEYAGLLPIEPDGVRTQVKWSWSANRPATTLLGIMDEPDVFNVAAAERRRREEAAA